MADGEMSDSAQQILAQTQAAKNLLGIERARNLGLITFSAWLSTHSQCQAVSVYKAEDVQKILGWANRSTSGRYDVISLIVPHPDTEKKILEDLLAAMDSFGILEYRASVPPSTGVISGFRERIEKILKK